MLPIHLIDFSPRVANIFEKLKIKNEFLFYSDEISEILTIKDG